MTLKATGQRALVCEVGAGMLLIRLFDDGPFPQKPQVVTIESVVRNPSRYHGEVPPTPESHGEALL